MKQKKKKTKKEKHVQRVRRMAEKVGENVTYSLAYVKT